MIETIIVHAVLAAAWLAFLLGVVAALVTLFDVEAMTLEPGRWYLGLDSENTTEGRFYIIGLGRWSVGIFPAGFAEGGPPGGADPCNCHSGACPLPEGP